MAPVTDEGIIMRLRSALAAGLLVAALAVPSGAMAEASWWVLLGSFAAPGGSGNAASDAAVRTVRRQAAACGVQPFNDLSMKFAGFAPGYEVVVLGPYGSPARASSVLGNVRRCVPGATLRQARYAGE